MSIRYTVCIWDEIEPLYYVSDIQGERWDNDLNNATIFDWEFIDKLIKSGILTAYGWIWVPVFITDKIANVISKESKKRNRKE